MSNPLHWEVFVSDEVPVGCFGRPINVAAVILTISASAEFPRNRNCVSFAVKKETP